MGFGFRDCAAVKPALHCVAWRMAALAGMAGLAGMATLGSAAHAQLVPSASAASAPVGDSMERAQRQADNVMRWIKVHSDKPRTAPAKPAEPAAPVPTKPALAVAPKAAAVAAPGTAAVAAEPVAPPSAIATAAAPASALLTAAPPTAPPIAPPAAVANAPEPVPPDEEEIPLKAIAQDPPVIPRNTLAALNTVAKLVVQFTVDTNGSVRDVQVLSSNRSQLNRPTLAAVTKWRFEPIKAPRIARIEFDFSPER